MSKRHTIPRVRKGQAESRLSHGEFSARFSARFADPAFSDKSGEIGELSEVAWEGYRNARKSPVTRKAGKNFADPDYELSVDWLQARAAIAKAQKLHDQSGRPRILLICGAARNDKTCPGEMSKSFRMTRLAKTIFDQHRAHVDLLDLRRLTRMLRRTKKCIMPRAH